MTFPIFITGCAGTGTTLVQRLFAAFSGVQVIYGETRLASFVVMEPEAGRRLVGKRLPGTIFSSRLSEQAIQAQLALIRGNGIAIVNCVREEGQVQASRERYLASMEQSAAHANVIAFTVDYRELTHHPDDVQARVSSRLNLGILHRWSTYPTFVPDEAFAVTGDARYRAREIEARR